MDLQRYHIRVDKIRDITLDHLKEWLEKHNIKTYLISEEVGTETSKIHYQGFVDIDLSIRSEKTWRANLRDNMRTTGKNQYSLTLKHGNLETYICKDGKIVLQSDDLHPLQIEQWKSESYKKKDKDGASTFTKKYLEAMKDIPDNQSRDLLTYNTIIWFKENSKIFDKFIIRRFVNLALVTFGDTNTINRMVNSIWDD